VVIPSPPGRTQPHDRKAPRCYHPGRRIAMRFSTLPGPLKAGISSPRTTAQ
jgi:hypothetical protein